MRLNETKDALLDSPQVLNFISGAVVILCDAIKADLQKPDSGMRKICELPFSKSVKIFISNASVRAATE